MKEQSDEYSLENSLPAALSTWPQEHLDALEHDSHIAKVVKAHRHPMLITGSLVTGLVLDYEEVPEWIAWYLTVGLYGSFDWAEQTGSQEWFDHLTKAEAEGPPVDEMGEEIAHLVSHLVEQIPGRAERVAKRPGQPDVATICAIAASTRAGVSKWIENSRS